MKKIIFLLPVALLVAAGCSSNQPVVENQTQPIQTKQISPTPTPGQVTPTPVPPKESKNTDLTVAENVAVNFMNDMKGSDYNAAYNKLSAKGQDFVNQEPQSYSQNDRLLYGLFGFIARTSLPDNGMIVTSSSAVNSSTITVTTLWKYAKTNSTVTFTLKLENGQWKIDSIK